MSRSASAFNVAEPSLTSVPPLTVVVLDGLICQVAPLATVTVPGPAKVAPGRQGARHAQCAAALDRARDDEGAGDALGRIDPEGALDLERPGAADRAGVEVQRGRSHVERARGQLDRAGVVGGEVPPLKVAVPVEPGLATRVPALLKTALAL